MYFFPAIICKHSFVRKTASSLHVATPREDNRATVASNSNMHGKMENLVKSRRAILEISVRTDRQTDTLITILRPHTRGVVNTYDLRYRKTLRLSHARYA